MSMYARLKVYAISHCMTDSRPAAIVNIVSSWICWRNWLIIARKSPVLRFRENQRDYVREHMNNYYSLLTAV